MPLPGAIVGYMRDTFTVNVRANVDAYGNASVTSYSCRGRHYYKESRTDTATSRVLNSGHHVVLALDISGITGEASIVFPDGTTHKVVSWQRHRWLNGSYFTVADV